MRRLFVAAIALACLNAPALASHRNYHHHSAKASVHGRHYARHGGAWCGAYIRSTAQSGAQLGERRFERRRTAGRRGRGVGASCRRHSRRPEQRGRMARRMGNDGHAVRTRYRSLRGAIAFRSVGGGRAVAAANSGKNDKSSALCPVQPQRICLVAGHYDERSPIHNTFAAVHPVLRHTDDPAPLVGVRG